MTKSRLEGSLDDFTFLESSKKVLIFKKSERGTHKGKVLVHGKTKTFYREQRVGRKESEKKYVEILERYEKEIESKKKIYNNEKLPNRLIKDEKIDKLIYECEDKLIKLYNGAFGTNINFIKQNISSAKSIIENFKDFKNNLNKEDLANMGKSKVRIWHTLDNINYYIKNNFENKNITDKELKKIKDNMKEINIFYGKSEQNLIPLNIFADVDKLGRNLNSINVDKKYSFCTEPNKTFINECYLKSSEYILNIGLENIKLIHGTAKLNRYDNIYYGHAWVELPNNIIFDGVDQQFYKKDEYYKKFEIKEEIIYDYNTAIKKMQQSQNAGPWHKTEGVVND